MRIKQGIHKRISRGIVVVALAAMSLIGCGGGGDGPAIEARPQTIVFAVAPSLPLGGNATVTATASSGLAVTYRSDTPFICSVNASNGLVTALTPGDCIVAADQYGNNTFAPVRATQTLTVQVNPNQTISFGTAPALTLYSSTTVAATASSGLPVSYSSTTPTICSVDSVTGLVSAIFTGNCTIAANQAGSSTYPVYNAATATQTIVVSAPPGSTVPGAPNAVTATVGAIANTVKVSIGGVVAGGSPISGFTVTSSPAGITGTGAASPITVTCPATCNGYAFTVVATNAVGSSAPSVAVDVITTYKVVETFFEPATQPNNSIFTGTFTFNSTTSTVTNLVGNLTESMTGGCATIAGCPGSYGSVPMTLVPLRYQLSAMPAALGGVNGILVTTFALPTTPTFFGAVWDPAAGVAAGGVYSGFPTAASNPGNAYAMIFVNTTDPTVPLVQAQIDKLAYADCAPGGMMGAVCMTGTTVAGYGAVGTMSGYPFTQVITKLP